MIFTWRLFPSVEKLCSAIETLNPIAFVVSPLGSPSAVQPAGAFGRSSTSFEKWIGSTGLHLLRIPWPPAPPSSRPPGSGPARRSGSSTAPSPRPRADSFFRQPADRTRAQAPSTTRVRVVFDDHDSSFARGGSDGAPARPPAGSRCREFYRVKASPHPPAPAAFSALAAAGRQRRAPRAASALRARLARLL